MLPIYLINALVTIVTAAAVFAVWVANRRRIAAETGGEAFFPTSVKAIDETYARILSEIVGRYTLGYVPPAGRDEGFQRIEVRLAAPADHRGAKVRARPGYYLAGTRTPR